MRSILFFVLLSILVLPSNGQPSIASESFTRGIAESKSGDHVSALRSFTNALEVAEHETNDQNFLARTHYNIGVSAYHLGKFDLAIPHLEDAIILSGYKYEKAYYALGMAYAETGDWVSARDAFVSALSINSKNGEAWFDLAYAYLALNEDKMAMKAFERSIRYKTVDMPIAENNLGVLFAKSGDLKNAEKHFKNAVRLFGSSSNIASENLNVSREMMRNPNDGQRGSMFALIERYTKLQTNYEQTK
ncbi:tetratricopeptide repeat protein [Leptolyngbya sp. 7M]|uniref:tetratricopeptide repeat protein n=1 Tax=Leptolyngbya sp. 7M TaxID=2812896 RepID=UPI001B8C2E37|nr:tetratricopeptide repeat protein [Leptolyngbya sp. 7M]QYO68295.1 tetratricopeptide repeat protein [Leptolyngbya sp. 7M]